MRYITITALFLLSAIFSMGQKDFTARTWASMDRAIYKQQRQIDSLMVRTRDQDRLEKRIMDLSDQQVRETDLRVIIFNAHQENAILKLKLDSLIKDLRDRPALRIGLQEGPVFRDPPIWQDGWPRPQMLQMDTAGHIIRIIDRNPVIFYSSPTGDSLYQWGRDPSFSRGSIQPLSVEGYDTGVTVIDPPGYGDIGDIKNPQPIFIPNKKKVHHKKKGTGMLIFHSATGKPTLCAITIDSMGRVTSHNGKSSKPDSFHIWHKGRAKQ